MRAAFSETLVRLGLANPDLLLLTGDHGYSLFDDFRRHCPNQYINAGIAEQNMVGMAAGLARQGFVPIVYGLSAFVPIRVLEQIKLDIAHDQLGVILVGDGAGFVYSHLGTSHQSMEDIACTRAIPHLGILSPSDACELTACMESAYAAKKPAYLRIGKSDRGPVHQSSVGLNIGDLLMVKQGDASDLSFIATGSMVRTATEIAATSFPDASVWSVPTIKPINSRQVAAICAQSTHLVVIEEHSLMGGLGSIIAEIAAENVPRRILRIGTDDRFSEYCGSYDYLLREHGLDRESITKRIHSFLSNK
jgi:transketolase